MDASLSPAPHERSSDTDRSVEQWVREAREGSVSALGKALEAGRKLLLLVANRALDDKLKSKLGASDLVQDTFAQARAGFRQFRGETEQEFNGWLLGILSHRLADAVRHYRLAKKRDVNRELSADPPDEVFGGLRDNAPTPGTAFLANDERRRVELALERLEDPWRAVLIARTWEGAAFADIGARHNCSAEAARKVWSRAIQKLRKLLAEIE